MNFAFGGEGPCGALSNFVKSLIEGRRPHPAERDRAALVADFDPRGFNGGVFLVSDMHVRIFFSFYACVSSSGVFHGWFDCIVAYVSVVMYKQY